MRKDLSFVGTTSVTVGLDPDEYRGLTQSQVTEMVLQVLRGVAPGVDFWEPDVEHAVGELIDAGT
jgi:hypothetical protein